MLALRARGALINIGHDASALDLLDLCLLHGASRMLLEANPEKQNARGALARLAEDKRAAAAQELAEGLRTLAQELVG